jgi:hypothetical protein
MEPETLHDAADSLTELLKAHVSDDAEPIDVIDAIAARDDLRELAYELEDDNSDDEPEHVHDVGDYLLDRYEPTPSPEANTVEVVELTGERADEFMTDEGVVVSEYQNNAPYPDDDLVVGGRYPNMSGDRIFHFPESRLME